MYRVYNHNVTLLGSFPTHALAQAEVREYRKQTGNEAYYIGDRQEARPGRPNELCCNCRQRRVN